jgi:glycosyltransferase involved in cell wall biosynthesis
VSLQLLFKGDIMSETSDNINSIFFFVEEARWQEGLIHLSECWLSVRGSKEPRLIAAIGRILINCGYPEWAQNWLFERLLYFPRNGEILRWLIDAAAEIRDHDAIIPLGEIHEEVKKISIVPNVHLMNALLATNKDERFLEVYNRQKSENMSVKGHRLYCQYLFYGLQDFDKSVKVLETLSEKTSSWTDFASHLALSYNQLSEPDAAIKAIDRPLNMGEANACFTAYEILRESNPTEALRYVNRSLKKYGYAPLHNSWKENNFKLENLNCGTLPFSDDERLVTVLMTVHQMNPMFETAVSSILNQTHKNLELILIDDCSSDTDHQMYKEIISHDPRVQIIKILQNSGTYVARNKGLEVTKGTFTLFMDSDDWTHPQRIEKALERLDSNPEAVVAVDSYVRLNESGHLAMIGTYFVRKCMLGLWRTDIVRDILGGFDTVRISADSELLERAQLIYGRVGINHVPVGAYVAYYHDESLTGGGRFGFGWRGIVGQRAKYAGAFRTWHRRMGQDLVGFNMSKCLQSNQPFSLPQGFHRHGNLPLPISKLPNWLEIIKSDCTSSLLSRFFKVPNRISSSDEAKVSVCMATFPERFATVGRTVETLLNQTQMPDEIHIWVNESELPPPLPDDGRIVIHLAKDNNLTDIGKFAAADLAPEGIIILADDDLKYPQDYVETMIREVNRFSGELCIGLHGVVFPIGVKINEINDYFTQRRVHLYSRGSSSHIPCHVMGTGTMAYDKRKVQFDHTQWDHNRMVDLHVGVTCQKMGVGIISIPRPTNWLTAFELEEDDVSIWESVKIDEKLQFQMMEVLGRVNDWTYFLHDDTRVTDRNLLKSVKNQISNANGHTEIQVQDSYTVSKRWKQKGRVLSFTAVKRSINFEMPIGWRIEDTHPDLFRLTHYLLMSPFEKNILDGWNPSRENGFRAALSYSAGIDSHACLSLMPKNTLVMYHERSGFKSALEHVNAVVMLEDLKEKGHPVIRVKSNHEQIRLDYGKSVGFSSDFGVGAMIILLADFYSINGVAYGMPLENSYLFHGHEGRDFERSWYWEHHRTIFKKAGLDLILPTAGISELINLKISEQTENGRFAQSCLRSKIRGEVCGICWKCFRKNSLRGEPVNLSKEVISFLGKQPLKQAASTIYAIQKVPLLSQDLIERFPHLEEVLDLNVDWLNRYHPKAPNFMPKYMRTQYIKKLNEVSEPMSNDEVNRLQNLVIYNQKEE